MLHLRGIVHRIGTITAAAALHQSFNINRVPGCKQKTGWILVFVVGLMLGGLGAKALAAENAYPYIINTLPVDGYAEKLFIPRDSPNILYAMVASYGRFKPMEKTGLYILDISDVRNLKQIKYFPITSPVGMDISPDERTAFVYSASFEEHDPKGWHGVISFDIAKPATARETGRAEIGMYHARLSADGKYLFVAERGLPPDDDFLFSIFRVSDTKSPELLKRVQYKHASPISAYAFYPIPGGKYLLIDKSAHDFVVYDISDPLNPKMEFDKKNNLGYPRAMGSDGTLVMMDRGKLVLGKAFPRIEKFGTLDGGFSDADVRYISEDSKTAYVSTRDKTLSILDLGNRKSPRVLSEYVTPDVISSAIPSNNGNLVLVGLRGSIAIIDPSKAIATAEQLRAAHAEALRQYNRKDDEPDLEKRIANAINKLKAAGIDHVVTTKPSGVSDKALAGILNDYGFFLHKSGRYKEAITIYRRAIELDPRRPVAYSNLGDSLRSQLSEADSFKEKIGLTKQIKSAYLQYKHRGGSKTKAVEDFLSLNIIDKPQSNVCEYIAAYTSQGRLGELFGSGNSVKKANGRGSMKVVITSEGSAHLPYARLIDNETNEELASKGEIAKKNYDKGWIDHIAVIPFIDGHHLLSYYNGGYLTASSPVGAAQKKGQPCRFSVRVAESFNKKAVNKKLCERIRSSHALQYINFDKPHSVTGEMIENAGFGEAEGGKAGMVDFDNDGEDDVLLKLHYVSGAGSGCHYDFFDLLSKDGNEFGSSKNRQLLYDLQGVGEKPQKRHPIPRCHGNQTGWFRHNGITYYETKYPGNQPENADEEFHTVSYVKDGKINVVCEASFKVRVKVRK